MTRWFVYEWGKPNDKSPTGWFSGHHSRNSTIITTSGYKQGISSTLPTYSWTLIPIPNWTCSVVTVPRSDAWLPSTWLTNCANPSTWLQSPIWKDCWLQSFSIHPHDEDQEDGWSQNPMVQIHSNFSKKEMNYVKNFVSGHNLLEQSLLNACATCVPFDGS